MEEQILLGRNSQIHEMPETMWKQHLSKIPQHSQARLGFCQWRTWQPILSEVGIHLVAIEFI